MFNLMVGLAGYEGGLYRAWVMAHPDPDTDVGEPAGDESRRLSFYGYSQNTGLLMEINNWVGRLATSMLVDEHGKRVEFHPILPPSMSDGEEGPVVKAATFENARDFFGG
ncbi:hypothetical protein BMAGN_1453 [Bifidobacterium magnum]|uniref:Uncharacterized protein n=1 Tax=Bifidobacterium magnum TaxID=1692 RepID=A0A087B695_9BIFI|nr:hypothetical protein BMAGN_1453 [Bifidobacterium magnum]